MAQHRIILRDNLISRERVEGVRVHTRRTQLRCAVLLLDDFIASPKLPIIGGPMGGVDVILEIRDIPDNSEETDGAVLERRLLKQNLSGYYLFQENILEQANEESDDNTEDSDTSDNMVRYQIRVKPDPTRGYYFERDREIKLPLTLPPALEDDMNTAASRNPPGVPLSVRRAFENLLIALAEDAEISIRKEGGDDGQGRQWLIAGKHDAMPYIIKKKDGLKISPPFVSVKLVPTPAYPFPPGTTLARGLVQDSENVPLSEVAIQAFRRPDDHKLSETKTTESGEFVLYFNRVKFNRDNPTIQIRIEAKQSGYETGGVNVGLKEGETTSIPTIKLNPSE